MKLVDYLKGKKTYIIAAIIFVLGGLQAIGYPVPEWIYPLLGSLGLGTLRAGVSK